MRALTTLLGLLAAGSLWVGPRSAGALELETSVQSVVSVVNDTDTKGGGAGLALEIASPITRRFLGRDSDLLVRFRAAALVFAGLAWTVELGAAYRVRPWRSWQPDCGLYLMTMGGDLARSIDSRGRLAGNPVALELGLNPFAFRLDQGWIAFAGVRGGPTLLRSGYPPLAVSVTLLEVGRSF